MDTELSNKCAFVSTQEEAYAEAICRIQLSRRDVEDTIIWLHHKKGLFIVKSAYMVTREVLLEGVLGLADFTHLIEYLLDQIELHDMEEVLVQAWQIWNQRNRVVHGGKFHDLGWLINRARELLEEFQTAQDQMRTESVRQPTHDTWQPLPQPIFKLNFDAVVFSGLNRSGFGAIIRNEKGEVMAIKGLEVFCTEEAELLACRKAIEFAVDVGFSELVIEGDNNSTMTAISTVKIDQSLLGNVVGDIQHLIRNLHWIRIDCIRRGGNQVAHVLAQFARNIIEDMYWMEDVPPIVREVLYQDANFAD
nr:hypothetical protein CFP56_25568 [Quercus suber]